jgi:hypothetical protein
MLLLFSRPRETQVKTAETEGFAGMNASQLPGVPQRFLLIKIRRLNGRPTGR